MIARRAASLWNRSSSAWPRIRLLRGDSAGRRRRRSPRVRGERRGKALDRLRMRAVVGLAGAPHGGCVQKRLTEIVRELSGGALEPVQRLGSQGGGLLAPTLRPQVIGQRQAGVPQRGRRPDDS